MNPWSTNATWQNFSSLYREVVAAREAPSEIGRFHHLTAALYFGMAALEAFLNQRMRAHMAPTSGEEEIFEVLRKLRLMDKLRKWPKELVAADVVDTETIERLKLFNEIRGNLTHPKTSGHDIYVELEKVSPDQVLDSIARYIVGFYEAHGEVFPYWLFGWNYLNPRPNAHEIILINNQQFLFSLSALGFGNPAAAWGAAQKWQKDNMTSKAGYSRMRTQLEECGCEPKHPYFPFQPKLCRRWWAEEHHQTCGNVTDAAIQQAIDIDRARGQPERDN